MEYQCPCCDYYSLSSRNSYEICLVCFWEDEGIDIDEPDEESDANHYLTLVEARNNFENLGACHFNMLENVISKKELGKYKRKVRVI